MSDRISLKVADEATAEVIGRELALYGVPYDRRKPKQSISFTGKLAISPKGVEAEFERGEFVELLSQALEKLPASAINGIFNMLESLKSRIKLSINGQPADITTTRRRLQGEAA
jgi:hypothetical protein